jgi:hypothetical protein
MTDARKSRLPGLQRSGFAIAFHLSHDVAMGAADLGGRDAIFCKRRGLADEIIPRGVLNGGGNILVAAGCNLRANHVAHGFAQCDSIAVHAGTLGRAFAARKRFVFPFAVSIFSNDWKMSAAKFPTIGNPET